MPINCFVSFADSRMRSALSRIAEQAKAMNFFDEIRVYQEDALDESFLETWRSVMKPCIRGFGYWCWKPYVILRTLESLPEGSTLLYCDVGCHFNLEGVNRLRYYYEELENDPLGIKAFPAYSSSIGVQERRWTKGDVFDYFCCRNNKAITETPQLASGHIFCKKSASTVQFMRDWYQAYLDNYSLIDDSESKSPNLSGFIENRHDQSIFSILYKLRGGTPLPDGETEGIDFSTMKAYPIWDMRDKGSKYKDKRFFSRVKRFLKAKRIHLIIKREQIKEKYPTLASLIFGKN